MLYVDDRRVQLLERHGGTGRGGRVRAMGNEASSLERRLEAEQRQGRQSLQTQTRERGGSGWTVAELQVVEFARGPSQWPMRHIVRRCALRSLFALPSLPHPSSAGFVPCALSVAFDVSRLSCRV